MVVWRCSGSRGIGGFDRGEVDMNEDDRKKRIQRKWFASLPEQERNDIIDPVIDREFNQRFPSDEDKKRELRGRGII